MNNSYLIIIAIGIIGLVISLYVNGNFDFFSSMAIIFIFIGIVGYRQSTGKKASEESNYRLVNSSFNCMNCIYCDMEHFDGLLADCKLFRIKIDKNHTCDLFKLSIEKLLK
jgi:hypothetical protein